MKGVSAWNFDVAALKAEAEAEAEPMPTIPEAPRATPCRPVHLLHTLRQLCFRARPAALPGHVRCTGRQVQQQRLPLPLGCWGGRAGPQPADGERSSACPS